MEDDAAFLQPWRGCAAQLPSDPALCVGTLANSLRYAFLPNSFPPNRLVAHLIVNTGSVNEADSQQGLAHVLEHALFLGTAEYPHPEALRAALTKLGMAYNADSNAYTDYRQTVYTFEGPAVLDEGEGGPASTLPTLLGLLAQMAFHARLDAEHLDNEKASVLSEASMRNSVEYRVEVASTGLVHGGEEGNLLPLRLPIGHARCIKGFQPDDLRAYYASWYRPEFMTLVLSGPVGGQEAVDCIQAVFGGQTGQGSRAGASGGGRGAAGDAVLPPFEAPAVMPAYPNLATLVPHAFGASHAVPLRVVQHPLLHAFGLSVTLKKPLASMQVRTRAQFVEAVCDILLSDVFVGRVKSLRSGATARCRAGVRPRASAGYDAAAPVPRPVFNGIGWDDTNAGGEGCAYAELSVGSDMRLEEEVVEAFDGGPADESALWEGEGGGGEEEDMDVEEGRPGGGTRAARPAWSRVAWGACGGRGRVWQRATACAVREAVRYARYGPCPNEWTLACQAFLKDCRDRAATAESVDTDELVGELEDGIFTGSAMPSRSQELSWVAHVLKHDVTLEYAKDRAASTFAVVEAAALAAVARLQALHPGGGVSDDVAMGSAAPPLPDAAACVEGLFDGIPAALSIFVCASGPTDSLTAAISADSGAGGGGGEPVEEGGALEPGAVGLLDRLGVTGRRAKLRALMTGEAGAAKEEGEVVEGSEDGEVGGGGGGEEGGEGASATHSEQPSKRSRGADPAGTTTTTTTQAVGTDVGDAMSTGSCCTHPSHSGSHRRRGRAPSLRGRESGASPRAERGAVPLEQHLYQHNIHPVEVLAALAHGSVGVVEPVDIDVPPCVVPEATLTRRTETAVAAHARAGREYGFVPVSRWPASMRAHAVGSTALRVEPVVAGGEGATGGGERMVDTMCGKEMVTLRLSSGLTVSYVHTTLEPAYISISLIGRGGHASEGVRGWLPGWTGDGDAGSGAAPYFGPLSYGPSVAPPTAEGCTDGAWIVPGSAGLGLSVLMAGGAAGLSAEQLERVASLWGITASGNLGSESIRVGMAVVAVRGGDGGARGPSEGTQRSTPLSRAFEFLHAYILSPEWEGAVFAREKDAYVSEVDGYSRNLETLASVAANRSMTGSDERFDVPSKGGRAAVTLAQVRRAVEATILIPANCQLVIVGDFDPSEVEANVLRWLGPWLPPPQASLPLVAVPTLTGANVPGTILPMQGRGGEVLGTAVAGNAGFYAWCMPFVTSSGAYTFPLLGAPPPPLSVLVESTVGPAARVGDDGSRRLPASIAPSTWVRLLPGVPIAVRGRVVRVPCGDPTPRCILYALSPSPGKFQDLVGVPTAHDADVAVLLRGEEGGGGGASSPWPRLRTHPLYLHRAHFVLVQVLNNRLYRRLRDKTGLCYAVSFGMQVYEHAAGGCEELTCTPSPVPELPPRALAHAVAVLRAFYGGGDPISDAETAEVVKPLVEALKTDAGRNDFFARACVGMYGVNAGSKTPAFVHGMAAFYAAFTAEELRYALRVIAGTLPTPLPLHVVVGVSGSLSFLEVKEGKAGGARRRKAGGEETGVHHDSLAAGGERALPVPDTEQLRHEWAAFLERVAREADAAI